MKEKFRTTGMNDSRKSDNNIVPEKPANDEVKTFAEQVEGRALTEGNTMNTAAVRTQGRGACGNVSYGGTRNPLYIPKGYMSETLRLWLRAPHFYPKYGGGRVTGIPTVTSSEYSVDLLSLLLRLHIACI